MYDWPTKNAAFRYVKFPFSILQTEMFQQRTVSRRETPAAALFSRGVFDAFSSRLGRGHQFQWPFFWSPKKGGCFSNKKPWWNQLYWCVYIYMMWEHYDVGFLGPHHAIGYD